MALDPLTRLYNRSALEEHLARTVELSQLSGQPACLLMVDVDHFKAVNDRYGHPFGDTLLRDLADCCTRNFPRRNDFVARYGGEEYAIVLQDTPLAIARSLGRRLLEAVESLRFVHEGETLTITVSIGIAELGSHEDASSWIEGADQALYRAKRAGRNQVAERPIAAPTRRRS
jgi:diguanylate cyclase (GGDEF)-like protein